MQHIIQTVIYSRFNIYRV